MAYFADQATTDVTNWNFNNYHVQRELGGGEFVSSESTLLCAGPPTLSQLSAFTDPGGVETGDSGFVFPVGVLEQLSVNQAQQVQPVYEIGSSRKYSIPGKVIGNIAIGRVLYSQGSLMKVLYAYYKQSNPAAPFRFNHEAAQTLPNGQVNPNRIMLDLPNVQNELPMIKQNQGYGDLWINLNSDLFKQPTGLLLYFRNNLDQDVGAVYVEQAKISSHQFTLSAGANILLESVSMEFDRLRPVNVQLADYVLANAN